MFGQADFEVIADQLRTIKGRFILSINDHPEIHAIFAGFEIEEVKTRYSIAGNGEGNAMIARELIISN
jgi:DNA adenine methylase